MNIGKRIALYLAGLICSGFGINLAKLAGLGISPVSSVPRALEVIWGLSLGTTTIIIYILLTLLQIVLMRKDFKVRNLLGIPVSLVFGEIIDLVGIDPSQPLHMMAGLPRPANYPMQLLCFFASLFLISLGVFLYLKPDLVSMPSEGLAQALAEKTGREFGNCKTFVDVTLICIALVLQITCLGGFSSFTSDTVVVREGTVLSAVLVGQTVKLFRKIDAGRRV